MDEQLISTIKERFLRVVDRISATKKELGNQEIKIVVVSKTQPIQVIQAAVAAGINRFGENYADEAITKINYVGNEKLEWHMIGHVQSRKAASVVDNFKLIHSVDSIKLARRLDYYCATKGSILPILIEVNTSGESSKYGFHAWDENEWHDLVDSFNEITKLSHIVIRGLMTMPPYFSDEERTRPYFKKLRYFQEFLRKNLPTTDWHELSMGTSNDFLVAVEEGATYLRIGEAILGKRKL